MAPARGHQQLAMQTSKEVVPSPKPSTREQTTQTSIQSAAFCASLNNFYATIDHKADDKSADADNDADSFEIGKYVNWSSEHSELYSKAWCCVGDLMDFCDRNAYKALDIRDTKSHNAICSEVKALLRGAAPFHMRRRFPGSIRNPQNLWLCIGRSAGVEFHLNRVLNVFRRPLDRLSVERQREAKHEFQLAINELRLDISARVSELKLYDREVFERAFQLKWVAQ